MPKLHLDQYIKTAETLKTETALSAWLLDLGKRSAPTVSIRQQENFVNGCQSQTWITANCIQGAWQFSFDSDSYFVLALGRIVTETFSGLSTEQIHQLSYHDFKPLAAHLNIQRQRGLQAFINRVHTLTTGATQ